MQESRERLQEAILNIMILDGGESTPSFIKQELRYLGWKGLPGPKAHFCSFLEELGFNVSDTDQRKGGGRLTVVSV